MIMENLNVTRDAGAHLGLNIVCQHDVKPLVKRKRAKKFNKYEKRRAKARQARQEEQDEIESKKDFLLETKDQVTLEEKIQSDTVETKVENETLVMEDTFQDEQQESPSVAFEAISKSQSRPPKSRKVHSTDTLENEEERARYMREFHARPMEMDRRSGATAQIIAPSRDSTHLFDQNNVDGFSSLHPRLHSSLVKLNITRPTIIQTRAIQSFQTNRHSRNLFIQSETGSGKTLAFLLPILQVRSYYYYYYFSKSIIYSSGVDRLSDGVLWLRHDSNLLDYNNNNNTTHLERLSLLLHSSVCM
jgi:hypothetical protein